MSQLQITQCFIREYALLSENHSERLDTLGTSYKENRVYSHNCSYYSKRMTSLNV